MISSLLVFCLGKHGKYFEGYWINSLSTCFCKYFFLYSLLYTGTLLLSVLKLLSYLILFKLLEMIAVNEWKPESLSSFYRLKNPSLILSQKILKGNYFFFLSLDTGKCFNQCPLLSLFLSASSTIPLVHLLSWSLVEQEKGGGKYAGFEGKSQSHEVQILFPYSSPASIPPGPLKAKIKVSQMANKVSPLDFTERESMRQNRLQCGCHLN